VPDSIYRNINGENLGYAGGIAAGLTTAAGAAATGLIATPACYAAAGLHNPACGVFAAGMYGLTLPSVGVAIESGRRLGSNIE